MKNTMGAFGELIPTDFPSPGAPWLLSGLASLYGRSGLADRFRMVNVAISNVPGSPLPLYMAGAKMLDYYPVSIAAHGVALNITVQSYMGQLCFGLIACRRAVPDVRDLATQMQRAFEALRQLPLPAAVESAGPAALAPVDTAAAAPAAKSVAAKKAAVRPVARPTVKPARPDGSVAAPASTVRRRRAIAGSLAAAPALATKTRPAAAQPRLRVVGVATTKPRKPRAVAAR